MEWRESINEIRKARDEDRLVIFVGSGVSANSEVPTWGRLIKEIAKEIEYDKCGECKKDCFDKESCKDRYNFTQDEYLRIPEYFYKSCKDKADYYDFIKKVLLPEGSSFKPNAIDDIIFDILPDHIITTNYDSLLEDSKSVNAGMYTVISDDKELIKNANKNYIIKMHGTFENPESMILKESDYIEYDHTHPLISTFIKGILVNHSFLFVGYSLNDYNLRLIMGWINYYRKQYNSKSEKVRHFVVNTEKVSDYEAKRLSDNNIEVIDLTSMSDDAKNDSDAKEKLSGEKGRLLYAYLSCIEDDRKFEKYCEVKDLFVNKCEVLKSYRKINIGDLNAVYNLGHDHIEGTGIVFNNSANFEKITKLIDTKDNSIIDVFQRSRITHLEWRYPFRKIVRSVIKNIPSKESDYSVVINGRKLAIDKAFRLYLDNDYIGICDYAEKTEDLNEKIYYRSILGKQPCEIQKEIYEEEYKDKEHDYVDIMLHKIRGRLALYLRGDESGVKDYEIEKFFNRTPIGYRKVLQYLRNISGRYMGDTNLIFNMAALLEKQDDRYKYENCAGVSDDCIKKLQGYAYNHYFFIKENLLPIDRYTYANECMKYYLKAIFSSYTPNTQESANNQYHLNEIDFDILIKFIFTEDLKLNISNYHVKSLFLEKNIKIMEKYKNLCNSLKVEEENIMPFKLRNPRFFNVYLADKLYNFNIIICLLDLKNSQKIDILKTCFDVFKIRSTKFKKGDIDTFESLAYLINNLKLDNADELLGDILDFLVKEYYLYDFLSEEFSGLLSRTVFKLSPYVKPLTIDRVKTMIEQLNTDKEKIQKIYSFRCILPMKQYKSYLDKNLELIDEIRMLFHFTIEKHISCEDKVLGIIAERIKKEIDAENLNERNKYGIQYFILLKIIYSHLDISILKPYAKYSPHLQFIFDPENFDYSQIDTSNYMWENLFKSKQYRKYFIKHKKEILSDNLKNIFETERDNRAQQKIVYGVLLDEDEIWNFPEERWEIKN